MENKISRILENALARTIFDMTKADINHSYKDHISIELLRENSSMAYRLLSLQLKSWEIEQIPYRIESVIKNQPLPETITPEEFVKEFRLSLIKDYPNTFHISSAHALLAILADNRTATAEVLGIYGITTHTIESLMRDIGDSDKPSGKEIMLSFSQYDTNLQPTSDTQYTMLEKFGTDLTELARMGKVDPVIGRDKEIERVIEILSRRKKNNPILIGEAGVGKSAIVEGLALRIATGDIPYTIRNKKIVSLDVSSLIAGTKFRGEFEERMQQLLDELKHLSDTIIFIDEIHTIVGAGATQGSLDTANILKPALARGDIQTIGATTLDEYRQHIESDSALERRFQRVKIEPTTTEQTLTILKKVAPYYERHHNVRYTDEALQACVALTDRYITDRHFPDKAIDALDEAGAHVRIRTALEPEALLLTQQQLQQTTQERQKAVATYAYETAASARIRELALKSRLQEQHSEWMNHLAQNPVTIDVSEMEQTITAITGIPIERISYNEAERIRSIKEHLHSRVIGQHEAVERVSRTLQRSRIGLKDSRRPIGVFLFVGPTGVGKTLLAKELSKWLFDKNRGLIRIDMSEYGQRHNVARLIGSPPGYVGYGEGGQLTEAVRRQPYSVVLFDEIEKAHPEVYNPMLQIFDEGHLTDGSGRKVDFRNTIIILTSNIGSRNATERQKQVGYSTHSKEQSITTASNDEYRKAIEKCFAPEFLNRIDNIVYFRTLTIGDVQKIIDLELNDIFSRIKDLGYHIEISTEAKERLATMGYEARYGVRSLRRTLMENIEEPLTTLIIEGRVSVGDVVKIVCSSAEGVVLQVAKKEAV